MKTFNASDLAHKRAEIFEAAKNEGAILQRKNTNGEVLDEFVMILNNGPAIYKLEGSHDRCDDPQCQYCSDDF
jgi:hypothetical protein|tara:strand:+ start:215 stop:433 length:219 start_codon:yes stop_codon:yes gene_type:complete